MGSDTGTPYNRFATILKEVIFMAERGMGSKGALIASTRNGADLIGVLDHYGTLEAEKFADFLVIDGNPLEDINHVENDKLVFKAGIQQY